MTTSRLRKNMGLVSVATFSSLFAFQPFAQSASNGSLDCEQVLTALGWRASEDVAAMPPSQQASIVGRQVELDLKIVEDPRGRPGTIGHWTYSENTQQIKVFIDRALVDQFTAIDLVQSTTISAPVETSVGAEKFVIKPAFMRTYGIAISGASEGWRDSPPEDAILPASDDKVAEIGSNLTLHIEGRVVPFAMGQAVQCVGEYIAGSPEAPLELRTQNCYVNVELNDASIMDAKSGRTLAKVDLR